MTIELTKSPDSLLSLGICELIVVENAVFFPPWEIEAFSSIDDNLAMLFSDILSFVGEQVYEVVRFAWTVTIPKIGRGIVAVVFITSDWISWLSDSI